MIRTVEIEAAGRPPGAAMLAPRPFDHWGQRLHAVEIEGARRVREIGASNSACRAYWIEPEAEAVRLRYEVRLDDTPAPAWVWDVQDNRHTVAAPELAAEARRLAEDAPSARVALRRLVDRAATLFAYGHPDERFTDGRDAVPSVCGLTYGSCIDINTYLLAAARAIGLRGQYVYGYWFHPEHERTPDGHCWLAFEVDGALEFWDVAHGMKWAESLGARVEEGLNPAGGRRVAMACGRGLRFETPLGPIELSHLGEPRWFGADRAAPIRPALAIRVEDPGGARDQFPGFTPRFGDLA